MYEIPHRTWRTDVLRPEVLIWPRDERYRTARGAFNLAVDQRPEAVALPQNERDVVDLVRFAADIGLRVAPQRTGHGATAVEELEQTLLLRTDLMRGVHIDADRRIARVAAGAQWQDVVPAASNLGLAALHGTASDVGIVGYTLGGGMSWYARKHGLAANHVVAIELVTADGRLRRVDHDTEPDLFWAMRGGGGNFGVVTAIEFELVAAPELYAGALFFPWERSGEVLDAWRAWTTKVPDELTSVGRILRFPALPQIPDPFRGQAFVVVEAVYLGSAAAGAELIEPLRQMGPVIDTVRPAAPEDISGLHMDPADPVAYDGLHQLIGDLPAEAIDDVVRLAGANSDSPLLSLEFRHLGGALGRGAPGHGALGAVSGSFATFGVGVVHDAASAAVLSERLAMLQGALEAYDVGTEFPNFALHAGEPSRFFDKTTLALLRRIRTAVDPEGLFLAKHAI